MKTFSETQLRKQVKRWIILFIVFLVLSGITAFPLVTELAFLTSHVTAFPAFMQEWILEINAAIQQVSAEHPQLQYGTDWLAFAHIVIATAFIGPLQDPVRNSWVIRFGMIACVMVLPLAFIAGPIRGIPFYWQLVDCSFGVLGLIPLYLCYRKIIMLEKIQEARSRARLPSDKYSAGFAPSALAVKPNNSKLTTRNT